MLDSALSPQSYLEAVPHIDSPSQSRKLFKFSLWFCAHVEVSNAEDDYWVLSHLQSHS